METKSYLVARCYDTILPSVVEGFSRKESAEIYAKIMAEEKHATYAVYEARYVVQGEKSEPEQEQSN